MIALEPVVTKADWSAFIDLPWKIYRDNDVWVPPLRMAVRDLLDVTKNPFFKHASMRVMMAYRGDEVVGRVIGVIDDNHNRFHSEKTVFFGFLEMVDDSEVCRALLDDIARWGKSKGMSVIRGPMNPSTNHECGLLVDGFENPPAVMMTYNPPYYAKHVESWGLTKAKDLMAYEIDGRKVKFADKLLAQAERLRAGGQVTFRKINMSKFEEELAMVQDIYNDAWEKNWGFVPMEPEEFAHMAKDLKLIIDPELVLIAEVGGQPAGFSLTLPDVNQAITKVRDGRLFPTGIFKLLWNLKGPGRRKALNRCRILTLGVKKEYLPLGIGPLLYTEYFKRGPALGYPVGEASWILEDNIPMNRALTEMAGERTKVYRIYDKRL